MADNGRAIVGLASGEGPVAAFVPEAFWFWQFRGGVVALDVATGQLRWKTCLVPEGCNGGAVWGSTGAVDLKHNQVRRATGTNCMLPDGVPACLNAGHPAASCMSAANHLDSIVATDPSSGAVHRAARGRPSDTWSVACGRVTPGPPGGVTGGLQWGSATDGQSLFVAIANSGPSTAGGGVGAVKRTTRGAAVQKKRSAAPTA